MLTPTYIVPSEPVLQPVRSHRIIMVEDDAVLRESIAEYLTRSGYDVTAVNTGLNFYHALAEQNFAIAIIDLGLPDIDGLQLTEYVRKNTSMRCIILTARDAVDARISGYNSGADLYLVKPVDCRELASVLASMIQRNQSDTRLNMTAGQWRLNRQNATLVTPSSSLVALTAREMDFLLCLAGSPEESIARTAILDSLGYSNDEFSNRALESLIRRLRRKIETAFGSSPIQTRHGIGYTFNAPLYLI